MLPRSLSCVVDGTEISKLSTTLKEALAFRAVALREGPRPCAAKRTEEQIVDVRVVQEQRTEEAHF